MSNPIVVVGIDGSDPSLVALARAIEEASLRNAEVHALYCSDVDGAILHLPGDMVVSTKDLEEVKRRRVWDRASIIIDSADVDVQMVDLDGYPADAIVGYCGEVGATLLVLGTRGRGRLASTFLGSTSLRALEHATCDVLIAKSVSDQT